MTENKLSTYLPARGITIVSGYSGGEIDAFVALYSLKEDNTLKIEFPKGHNFIKDQKITLHLDNRTGVDEYDADLRVYRISYKGRITEAGAGSLVVRPEEFMLYYSNDCIIHYEDTDFIYDEFESPLTLPESPLGAGDLTWDEKERHNKLGVLISRLPSRPHSSLMAFLSTENDDILLITLKGLFKSKALRYDRRCCFAIDHRAEYVFEEAYDWNYTIISADAFAVSRENAVFDEIQYQFINKNPWESSFFLSPEIEMFHLKPRRILQPECIAGKH